MTLQQEVFDCRKELAFGPRRHRRGTCMDLLLGITGILRLFQGLVLRKGMNIGLLWRWLIADIDHVRP